MESLKVAVSFYIQWVYNKMVNHVAMSSISNFKRLKAPICILAIMMFYPALTSYGVRTAADTQLISIEAKDETLQSVLKKIAKITGYRIFLDKRWANLPITIKLNNESLTVALRRLFKDLNYAIIWDETAKKISFFLCHHGDCEGVLGDVSLSGSGQTIFDQATSTIAQ